MKLCDALDQKLMDNRIRDRHVDEGKVSLDEVDKYLNQLPDESENMIEASPNPANKEN